MPRASDFDPKTQAELADMALALAHNPETRKDFAKLTKKAKLGIKFPDVDAEEGAQAAVETLREEIRTEKRERETSAVAARLNAQRANLITARGFTEETVKTKLEPFMQEKGIADYDDAAILFAAANPPETPRPEIATKGVWELPQGDWVKDPHGNARIQAHRAIADIVAARR